MADVRLFLPADLDGVIALCAAEGWPSFPEDPARALRAFIGDDPFAILLPDDLVLSDVPCTKQLADAYYETGGCVVAVTEVPREHTNRYGRDQVRARRR